MIEEMVDSMPAYLLSIREAPAEAILSGVKPHEFRKRFERYRSQAMVFLYATKPTGKIIGQVFFDTPIFSSVSDISKLLIDNGHDTEESLKRYLDGSESVYALPVLSVKRFKRPVSLQELREEFGSFNPPMSYSDLNKKKNRPLRDYLVKRAQE